MPSRSGVSVCVTVTAGTIRELRQKRDAAFAAGADLVELRLDGVTDIDAAAALAGRGGPVIVTCRPIWEGGRFDGSEEERTALLRAALDLGAEFVDIEWRAHLVDALDRRVLNRVVISHHVFDQAPQDPDERLLAMHRTGAGVVKMAVTATHLADLVALREAARPLSGRRTILLAMGTAGWATRLLPWCFGSAWTYAGDSSALGQIPLSSMLHEFRFREVSSACELYGVVGKPIGHSASPAIHNSAYHRLNRDAVFVPLESNDADDVLAFARALGFKGLSVTAPLKIALFQRADRSDALSTRVGAVNTLRFGSGLVEATNTDVPGFLAPLARRGVSPKGLRAAVLGAGGAARAVAVALDSCGARVTICARDPEKARDVAAVVGGSTSALPPARGSWDLLVNATAVGTFPHDDEVPFAGRFDGRLVYDLVYNPPRSRLLREAEAAGCQTIGGLEMLVAQACRQFEWWTGEAAPAEAMKAAAQRWLEQVAAAR